jgi:spore coat protein U-like protein
MKMTPRRRFALAGTVMLLGALVPSAHAATGTSNLGISATVTANCTIATTAVAFGAYDPIVANATANLDAVGSVVVACTKGSSATIGLGLGANAQTTVRRMADGATSFLTFELYTDTTRTTVWGTTGTGLLSTGAAPSKASRSFTVYGRVPSAQDVPAGTFADTVVATVNF